MPRRKKNTPKQTSVVGLTSPSLANNRVPARSNSFSESLDGSAVIAKQSLPDRIITTKSPRPDDRIVQYLEDKQKTPAELSAGNTSSSPKVESTVSVEMESPSALRSKEELGEGMKTKIANVLQHEEQSNTVYTPEERRRQDAEEAQRIEESEDRGAEEAEMRQRDVEREAELAMRLDGKKEEFAEGTELDRIRLDRDTQLDLEAMAGPTEIFDDNGILRSTTSRSTTLYVGNLDLSITEAALFEIFCHIAPVHWIRVVRHRDTWSSLGYAFLAFHELDDGNSSRLSTFRSLSSHQSIEAEGP